MASVLFLIRYFRAPLPRLPERWRAAEPLLYGVVAAVCTLYVACWFYGSMRLQTLYALAWADPGTFDELARSSESGPWSAPLDDVFIHFDFARSAARGYPFQWSEGNGYSSGGTSLLYPLILAFGYWFGARGLELMFFAALIACVSVFALLLSSRRAFTELPRATSYLAPLALLSIGGLNWTLFSGMEVAVLLAVWGGAFIAWDDLRRANADGRPIETAAAMLGGWNALLVAVRPESVTAVAVLSLGAAWLVFRAHRLRRALGVLLTTAVPGALIVIGLSVANHVFTGQSTAAGALVKLEIHHPHLTLPQVFDAWLSNLVYQVLRVTHFHLSAVPYVGVVVWVLAAVPLLSKKTRPYALVLWCSAIAWTLLVAMNGQVRWQNERYAMPALAWLLLSAALGMGLLLSLDYGALRRGALYRALTVAGTVATVLVFAWAQAPRFRDQVWFFGRASRNILDQQVRTGLLVRERSPSRVLVGDAGAIPYMADVPALDIIGLGGYHDLPFARAARFGVAAAIELIERIPDHDRPSLLAIYPSWWGSFPGWFGHRLDEVPVRGNVICGGASKVLYQADWRPFRGTEIPFTVGQNETIVDTLDIADLVSEKEHHYRIRPSTDGFVTMELLPRPDGSDTDLWDAGRVVGPGVVEAFQLSGFTSGRSARLVFRLTSVHETRFEVRVSGNRIGEVVAKATAGWAEASVDLPAGAVRGVLPVELVSQSSERVLFHVWAIEER